jgi:hypothetical protein
VIKNREWARQITMPPVSLTEVSVDTAFKLVDYVAESDRYRAKIMPFSDRGSPSHGVYILTIEAMRQAVPAAVRSLSSQERRLEIFALPHTAGLQAKHPKVVSILTAVDEALGIQSPEGSDRPTIRFHPDSGLLLVYGTKEETRIVGEIADRVTHDEKEQKRQVLLQKDYDLLLKDMTASKIDYQKAMALKTEQGVLLKAVEQRLKVQQERNQALMMQLDQLQMMNAELKAQVASLKAAQAELKQKFK